MNSKPIEIVDESDRLVGTATMEEAWAKGLWHRIVRIMVEDTDGRLLLQLRAPNMKTSPNRWDHSAAGHVDESETYEQAALRELAEETGIQNVKIEEIANYQSRKVNQGQKLNRFNRVYRVIVLADMSLKPQVEEVAALRWFTVEDARELIADYPDKVTDGLKYVVKHLY